ncbi:hypothetical protein [Mesorhizobium sp. M1399]|uniref:hypothetical protein n=1 Tax=Mesorhizobium sp. M1399 TaxID=2957096 RepID=UPI00333C6239
MTNEDLNGIGLSLCEAEGILDVLIFLHLEAEPPDRLRLNDAMVTLLHLALERLRKAEGRLSAAA